MSPVESITVGEWNHVALVYDGGAKNSLTSYRILIDGVEQVLAFGSGPIGGISDVNYIGREKNSTGFQGAIDDVYVYNRALSSQEIIQYYEDATSPPLQPLPATSNIFVFAAAVSVGILGYALLRRVPRSQS